jgi:uncharacterized C2H2 Zn-finger protein
MPILKLKCPRCQNSFEYIIKERVPRSLRQNKYYWDQVVGIPAQHFGYLNEEMHRAYQLMFLRKFAEGKPETVRSTTSLDTKEFVEYVNKCREWAADNELVIPDPEQCYE